MAYDAATAPDELKRDFVHLHCHSHYSFLDGGVKVQDMVARAHEWGMPAVALTDHGVMCGAMDLYMACHKLRGDSATWPVKPIIGTEAYICDDHSTRKRGSMHHLLMLAADQTGYRNLIKLNAFSHRDGYYYKPRIDFDLLAAHSEGLIVTSGCLAGEVAQAAASGRLDEAERIIGKYRDLFGDRYYIELQNHDIPDETKACHGKLALAKKLGIPFICTNDSHYLNQSDHKAHDALLCICTGALMSDNKRFRFDNDSFWFKDQQAMWDTFPADMREGLFRTREIADRCNVELDFGDYFLPRFPDLPDGMDENAFLRAESIRGCKERYGDMGDAVRERMEYELDVIEEMGFPGYFLITADFINWAKRHDIPVGPGRGSAAGSIVAYALGITDVDPLRYDLLFERFLNPSRISMPDIDIDFDPQGRERVIDYVRDKYGEECVCQIITYSQLKAKAVIRDVGRVMDMPLDEVNRIAKMIPEVPGMTLKRAFDEEPKLREVEHTSFRHRDLFDMARRLEGLNRHTGIHAAGVIIAPGPLPDYIPLYRASESGGDKPVLVTQFSMEYCEMLGLLKMDFLGLRNLTVIKSAIRLIGKSRGVDVDWDTIPLDDATTYELLCRGEAIGVFQLESEGMRKLLQRLRPDCFEDLIALLALYRPGPLGAGMVDRYVEVKHGREERQSLHEAIDDILDESNGIILYQEQVMRVAARMGGFSLAEADNLRKAMGKKKAELMAAFREKFVAGAEEKGYEGKKAGEIFDLMAAFAAYGFNKSHSTAYAFITFQTAYLKANYPVEYQAGLLSSEIGNQDKLVQYLDDTRNLGVVVRGPDVTVGESGFNVVEAGETDAAVDAVSVAQGKVDAAGNGRGARGDKPVHDREMVFGLGGIKGVGVAAIDAMVVERNENGPYKGLLDFAERLDPKSINSKILETLIRAGALDQLARLSMGTDPAEDHAGFARRVRPRLLAGMDTLLGIAQSSAAEKKSGQMSLFGGGDPEPADEAAQLEGLLPEAPAWSDQELLQNEKETLGFFFSSHPLARHAQVLEDFATHDTESAPRTEPGTRVLLGGVANGIRSMTIKKPGKNQGRQMGAFVLEDLRGALECVVFADAWENCGPRLMDAGDSPVIFVQGRADVRDEKPQVIVDHVIPVDEVHEELTQLVQVRVRADAVNDGLIGELRRVFEDNRGDVPVRMAIGSDVGKVIVSTGGRWKIRPTPSFREAMTTLLGPAGVSFHSRQ